MRLVYRPNHPLCNENGLVDVNLVYDTPTGAAPFVISDNMDQTRHMASGKYYDSKSEFRKATKAYGCIEVGNDAQALPKPRKPVTLDRQARRETIRRAMYEHTK
jgi:hypothetical protein